MKPVPPHLLASVREIRVYIDKAQVWLDGLSPSEERKIKAIVRDRAGKKRLDVAREQMPNQPRWRCRLQLNQPTAGELRRLQRVLAHGTCLINYVELARDLVLATCETKDELRAWLEQRIVIPDCKSREGRPTGECTLYFNEKKDPVNFVLYSDAFASVKIGAENVYHEEHRRMSAEQLRVLGLDPYRWDSLLNVEHARVWREKYALYEVPGMVEVGRRFREAAPAYRNRAPKCSDARLGSIVLRAAGAFDRPGAAHSVFHWAREQSFLKPDSILDQVDATPLLPREPRRVRAENPSCSGLSEDLWQQIVQLIPAHENTHRFGGGRPRASDRDCMAAVLAVARGCSWRQVSSICKPTTARDRMKRWQGEGVFERMKQVGLDRHSDMDGVDWALLLGR